MTEDPAPLAERRWLGPVLAAAYVVVTIGAVAVAIGVLVTIVFVWKLGGELPADVAPEQLPALLGLGVLALVTAVQFAVMGALAAAFAPFLPLGRTGIGARLAAGLGLDRLGAGVWYPAAVVLGLTAGMLPSYVSESLGRALGQTQAVADMLALLATAPRWEAAAMVGVVTFLGPAVEELVFRGFLYAALRVVLPAWATILATSLMFAASHMDPLQVLAVLPLGLVMGWLRHETGGIAAPLVMHVTNNALASAVMFASETPSGGELDLPITLAGAGVAVATAAGAWAIARRSRGQLPD